MTDFSHLERPRHLMPGFVEAALTQHNLMEDYRQRPAYQQNDYLGWVLRAKQETTRQKRLQQMLEELEEGGIYMGMAHPPSRKE